MRAGGARAASIALRSPRPTDSTAAGAGSAAGMPFALSNPAVRFIRRGDHGPADSVKARCGGDNPLLRRRVSVTGGAGIPLPAPPVFSFVDGRKGAWRRLARPTQLLMGSRAPRAASGRSITCCRTELLLGCQAIRQSNAMSASSYPFLKSRMCRAIQVCAASASRRAMASRMRR